MGHHHHHQATKNIGVAFFLNLSFTIIEFIGGILTNSVAILSDAIHDLGDSVALGSSWYLEKISNQKANKKFTFGYRRLSIISAFLNCIILLLGSVIIIVEAIKRIMNPEVVDVQGMMYLAILGIIVNSIGAWKVIGGKSLNERTISWHLLEDVLGWVAVLIGSIVMSFYPLYWIDTFLSIAIALFISYKVLGRFKESFLILAQTVPKNISLDEIEKNILEIQNVISTHQTLLWSLDEENLVFSSHIVIEKNHSDLLPSIQSVLKNQGIHHQTLQLETEDNNCEGAEK
ncbi:cation diffusion facilitator family transporter [Brumimicrobium oceani]|uniref:Cation transporter n=1 Tax=Brumimicrobium oceani TaxID=2100725 RepID=A0A2U2XB52_9FLAO|nr:cation diffusion facilitator family transporter [Brumimicrobium oceani]PWH85025.1 cation transporter [Brumimicrobium oceani]